MWIFWLGVLAFIAGYVAAGFTWDRVHTMLIGAEEKAQELRKQARDLEAKLRK